MEYTGDKSWRNPPEPIPEELIGETKEFDVVVAGLGHAGTAAARAAAEAGARVCAIELFQERGFRTFGMDVGHINSKFLEKRGIPKVDPIDLFNEMMRRSLNQANPELVMQYCQNCGDAFDWYMELVPDERQRDMKVKFWPPLEHFSEEISGFHFWHGTAVFLSVMGHGPTDPDTDDPTDIISLTGATKLQHERIRQLGGVLDFGVSAEQLEQDENGRVTALIGKKIGLKDKPYIRYKAEKGVILALGGIGGNRQMCRDLMPNIMELFPYGQAEFTSHDRKGRGQELGVWAGGKIEPPPFPVMGGDYTTRNGLIYTFGPLWINDKGDRFCNELFGDPCITGKVGPLIDMEDYYVVYDSDILDHVQYGPPAHTSYEHESDEMIKQTMQAAVEAGDEGVEVGKFTKSRLYAGNTIEELVSRLGLEPEAEERFIRSFNRYNKNCRKGRDDDFGKDPRVLKELKKAPFFAERMKAKEALGRGLCAVGGLVTDGRQNVLTEYLKPIPGLYATGNTCGRRFGPQYNTPIAGMSIGMAITLGREAGKNAAAGV